MQGKHKPSPSSNTPEGLMVNLKDKLILVMGLDVFKVKALIDRFVTTKMHVLGGSRSHFAKTNIYNEIFKSRMTVKVFFKFLRIINAKSVTFTVTVVSHDNKIYTVSHEAPILHTPETDES